MDKTYVAIDLKSFYASVELSDRHLDPLSTHLVVADSSRTEKTICLAVSPSLKAYGIPGRARLFEVVEQVRAVNAWRFADAMTTIYDRIVDPDLTVRRISIAACNLVPETEIPPDVPEQLDLFTDYEALNRQKAEESAADMREKSLQKTALSVHGKFGKNALLKGMNLQEGATAMQRNQMIGGHRAGDKSMTEKRNME